MEYNFHRSDEVSEIDLSDIDTVLPNMNIEPLGYVLDTNEIAIRLWYFEPGEEIVYHAHAVQEELYLVLEGEFEVKLGRSGETEEFEAGPGDVWVAAPMIGHGHRYTGDERRGAVIAIGAPNVEHTGLDPHDLDDEEIDETLGKIEEGGAGALL